MMRDVVMLIHHEGASYGASFPDYPGCTTVANDASTLWKKGVEALEFHLECMKEDGDPIPRPRLPHAVIFCSPSSLEGAMMTVIKVEVPD
jgi:predicted RNase H-like HicB family nuclease